MWTHFVSISLYLCLIFIDFVSAQLIPNGQLCDPNKTECYGKQICHQNRCKCPKGYGFDRQFEECLKFDDYLCDNDSDCNVFDSNRWCNPETRRCECNHLKGFYESRDKTSCKAVYNHTCTSDTDCPIDYTHCKDGFCKCWPEFQVNYEKIKIGLSYDFRILQSCVRKICSTRIDCQTPDNLNLVCNNTICECEYGYSMNSHRVCVKINRRQNCNITCQIIGGLFASIFMLSLIYWCFYCCYSIVNNYKMHNRRSDSIQSSHMADESPQIHRFLRSQSTGGRLHRNSAQNYSINSDERFYCFDGQTPPTYSQLSDEPPDYETVVHMKPTHD